MTAATIYMTLLGPAGLARVAEQSLARTRELVALATGVPGVRAAFTGPRFHEAVLQLDVPVTRVLERMAAEGVLAGVALDQDYPDLGAALLVCATETKTEEDLQRYVAALRGAVR